MGVKKRLRMTLDFEVTISEITEESLREHCRMFTDSNELLADPETHRNLGRQQRLQRALLADEESLRRFLTYVVVSEVNSNIGSRLGEMFGLGREETEGEILEPVLARLDEEDARFYASVAGVLWENVELLNSSFVARWMRAVLEEVTEVAEGAINQGESDNLR
jgi:hypothetical protein